MSLHDYLQLKQDPRFVFKECGHFVRSLEANGLTSDPPYAQVYELRGDEIWQPYENNASGITLETHLLSNEKNVSGCDICTQCKPPKGAHPNWIGPFADFLVDFQDGKLMHVRRRIEEKEEDAYFEYEDIWCAHGYVREEPKAPQFALDFAAKMLALFSPK